MSTSVETALCDLLAACEHGTGRWDIRVTWDARADVDHPRQTIAHRRNEWAARVHAG